MQFFVGTSIYKSLRDRENAIFCEYISISIYLWSFFKLNFLYIFVCDKSPIFWLILFSLLWELECAIGCGEYQKRYCFQKETSKWFMWHQVMGKLLAHLNSLSHCIICQLYRCFCYFLNLLLENNYFPNYQHLVSIFVSDILQGLRTTYLGHSRINSEKSVLLSEEIKQHQSWISLSPNYSVGN